VAEWEREMIGQRTREGLAVKRSQGVTLGRPRELDERTRRRIRQLRARGWSYPRIAAKLNADHVPTAHGGKRWYPASVRAALSEAERGVLKKAR
jgi:DNA invertase Pin-like site-specific DNA recombinase